MQLQFFHNLSIRGKLMFITISVSTIALLIASGIFLAKDILSVRRELLETIGTDAEIICRNSTAALSFQNAGDATETLSALRADETVDAAWMLTPDGKVFASYFRDGQFPAPSASFIRQSEPLLASSFFQLSRPVMLNGQMIGSVVVRSNLLEVNQHYHDYLKVILLVIIASSIISLVLVARLQRAVSQPILDLAETAKTVSSQKNYAIRAKQYGTDELGTLVSGFNQMLDEIQKRDNELKAHRAHLEDQVSSRTEELRRVNAEMLAAKEVAEQSSRMKSAFLANMSHEIRTPMTAIVGYAELMLDPTQTESDRQDCVQVVRRNGAHLLELINDILDISKIEADKMTVERIWINLPQLVNEIVSLMRLRAVQKNLQLDVTFDPPIPERIKTDQLRVRQILVNLIGNAIKFTTTGKVRLHISTQRGGESDRIAFAISDTGIGMDAAQMGRLFQSFSQADESMTRRFGGTGLGLTISKKLAVLLGGDITVQSAVGSGSCFTVEIDAGPLQNVPMLNDIAEALTPVMPNPQTTVRVMLNAHILLAEDGLDNQRLISTHLRRAGAEVTIAPNGQIALDLVSREKFDLILMDMQMPVLDGYGATSRIRKQGHTMPIIALTAHAMAHDRAKCINAGCTEYLTKPVDRDKLISTVAEYLPREKVIQGGAADQLEKPQKTMSEQNAASAAQIYESQFAGDPDMKELVDEYIGRLPIEVSKMASLLAANEIEPLRRVAHQLKGSGGGYGFNKITELAAVADHSIKQSAPLEQLKSEIDSLIAYIRCIRGYDIAKETANATENPNH
jgi:signal transduction histidine kinase/CheY-like chemotaxis protein/HPt (histidine-containing phosphotransfer) domain-containing protein